MLSDAESLFRALADSNRLRIIEMLTHGERCACRLLDALNIGQPTLSYHMSLLCDAGLVVFRKQGRWVYYKLDTEGCAEAVELLSALTRLKPDAALHNDCCDE